MRVRLLLVFLLASCASDPPPQTQVGAAAPPPEPTASAAPSAAPVEESVDAGNVGILGALAMDGGNFASLTAHEDDALGVGADASVHPTVRQGTMLVNGRLPPEIVRRIMRAHFPAFRLCYELALQKDPTIAGRVVVRFVIGPNGDVTSATDDGSDLASSEVRSCIIRRAKTLMFPKPESGRVTVVFPMIFGKT